VELHPAESISRHDGKNPVSEHLTSAPEGRSDIEKGTKGATDSPETTIEEIQQSLKTISLLLSVE
jgi:hypothetical protein